MKTVYPGYYKKFRCIADKCKHSCCVGWEIDIDEDSLSYYEAIEGDFANRLRKSISYDGTPHFILKEDDRCPFLNEKRLCDMYIELGEESLCDICTDHPRFRNYYADCVEMGVGLCCEAAAELILNNKEPFELVNFDLSDDTYTDEEREVLTLRSELIDIMKDRSISVRERHEWMLSQVGFSMSERPISEWCDFYLKLERLDPHWGELLCRLRDADISDVYSVLNKKNEIAAEQLTIYFLYRYIAGEATVDEIPSLPGFAVISVRMILALLTLDPDNIADFARMYSSEIEYSDENVAMICEHILNL